MIQRVGARWRLTAARALLARGGARPGPAILATLAIRLREIEDATERGPLLAARAAAQLVPLTLAVILVSAHLAFFALVPLVPFALLLGLARRRFRQSSQRAQHLLERLHVETDELTRHLDLFRVYGKGEHVVGWLRESSDRARQALARVEATRAGLSSANEVLGALALLGLVAVADGRGWAASWLAVVPPLLLAYRPLRDWADARSWIARGQAAAEAVRACALEERPFGNPSPPPHGSEPPSSEAVLEVSSVFVPGLSVPCSFTAQPRSMVCLMGPTGVGKTTLLRALLGLEPSARGEIRFGGRDITRAPVGPGARPFAWVPQDAPLVTGTVEDNVAGFAADAASARAALAEVGQALPRDALIGSAGRPVSGGERRLLSLARALASGLPVLLIDEPTEGLDPAATQRVLAALRRLAGDHIVVVVTHRAEVAAVSDQVVHLTSSEPELGGGRSADVVPC